MDNEPSLNRVIEHLAARFPHHAEHVVAETVYATYSRLRGTAIVTTHLSSLTQRQASDALSRMPPHPDATS